MGKHEKTAKIAYFGLLSPLMGDGFMGGLAPHFFVFDFFTNFHFDFSKDLLEVLRFFPLLNHGGKIFEKKFFRLAVT